MDTNEPQDTTPAPIDPEAPALFDWQEMARRIGRTPDWVRRHTKQLPHHRLPGNRVKFSQQCVDLFLEQTLVNPAARTPRSRARDRGNGW